MHCQYFLIKHSEWLSMYSISNQLTSSSTPNSLTMFSW